MELLYSIARLRSPLLDAVFSVITKLGYETAFLVVGLVLLWCVSKRAAFYLCCVCFLNLVSNQILKNVFRTPRPWQLDPSFQIVEAARAEAIGYSFPSGHTQNIVSMCGCTALSFKNRILRCICAALVILVPFSRLYLGVHFLQDIVGAFCLSAIFVLALRKAFSDEAHFRRTMPAAVAACLALCILCLLLITASPLASLLDENSRVSALNIVYKMLGCVPALFLIWYLDVKWLHFDVKAPLLGQILKTVFGLALLLAIRTGLKQPLAQLLGTDLGDAVRYFAVIIFAGTLWPLTFRFFAKIGRKKDI